MLTMAPPPALGHVAAEYLAALEDRAEVDRHDAVPVGVGRVEEGIGHVHAGAVDEDIGPAGLLERCGQQVLDRRPLGDINRAPTGAVAASAAVPPRGSCILLLGAGDYDVRPGAG